MTDIQHPYPKFEDGDGAPEPRDPRIDGGLGASALFGDGLTPVPSLDDYRRNPNITYVSYDAPRVVFTGPGEASQLLVDILDGNTVLAITAQASDGKRAAYVQQFGPPEVPFGPLLFSDGFASMPDDNSETKVLLMTPGDWKFNNEGNLEMIARTTRLKEGYEPLIKQKFGPDTEVDVHIYSVELESHAAMVVDLPADGGANILPLRVPGFPAHPSPGV